jgi:hypothetical protein
MKDYDAFAKDYPQLSRDTGAKVLSLIQGHPNGLQLENAISFAADSLFCEWAWAVDLDRGTFEAYSGFNTSGPLDESERFAFLNEESPDGYYPVRKVAEWSLDCLPSDQEFLSSFGYDDEKEGEQDA